MDSIDNKILRLLQINAKQNVKEIANKVGLSVTPTYERIKKLEKQGVIKSYVALLNKDKIDKQIIAYCQITMLQHEKKLISDFASKISAFSPVMECHHVSGNFDFLVKIVCNDMNDFYEFINQKLSSVEGISTIHSSFVMNSFKDSTAYELY